MSAQDCRRLLDYLADAIDAMQHPGGLTDLLDAENKAITRAVRFIRSTEVNLPEDARVVLNPAPVEKALRESRVNDEREVVQLPTGTFNELVAYARSLAGSTSGERVRD